MLKNADYAAARELLLSVVSAVGTERLPLSDCGGRILAQTLTAKENIPPFDRSPYDGYAIRSADVKYASSEAPVTLRVLETIPAGAVPTQALSPGTAAKILTGAPIPEGADAVVMFEKTEFTEDTVTLFTPVKAGSNIIRIGDDVREGTVLAEAGSVIDPGLAGTLAAQGVTEPLVYRVPRIGLFSTGSELVEADCAPDAGQIRNTNRFALQSALHSLGCSTEYFGIAGDTVQETADILLRALSSCDAVISTGGVSVGDFDLTPAAMELAGADIILCGIAMKPGMACVCAKKDGKLILGLSGNPASALTSFHVVATPALKRLSGRSDVLPAEFCVMLKDGFNKSSPKARFLRGRLETDGSSLFIRCPREQGNGALSSMIGCNAMALIPAGSGPLGAGCVLKGFLI